MNVKNKQLKRLFGCLHLPGFEVEAALAGRDEWRARACVVSSADGDGLRGALVVAVNEVAARRGVVVGDLVARVVARHPGLCVLARDPVAEAELAGCLAGIAESLSPDFERVGPGTLIVDWSGSRPPAGWRPALSTLRLALAHTPDLAHLAALAGFPFAPRPFELDDFDPLPLGLLRDFGTGDWRRLLALFDLWGLRTLGDLRKLPRQDLVERAGPETGRIHDLLHGRHMRLLRCQRTEETFVRIEHFENPIDSMEIIVFQLNRLLLELCEQLAEAHLAASKIDLKLFLEAGDWINREWVLGEPCGHAAGLLLPIRLYLEGLRVSSGVLGVELGLEPVVPVAGQCEWLGRRLRWPERWPETWTRLESLVGRGRAGVARLRASHLPDDFEVLAPVPPGGQSPAGHPAAGGVEESRFPVCDFPLRRYRPPLEVAVASDGGGLGLRPLALLTGPHAGPIRDSRGPFPLAGDWWNPATAWRRVEWDIEAADRELLRIALLPPDRWRIEGRY